MLFFTSRCCFTERRRCCREATSSIFAQLVTCARRLNSSLLRSQFSDGNRCTVSNNDSCFTLDWHQACLEPNNSSTLRTSGLFLCRRVTPRRVKSRVWARDTAPAPRATLIPNSLRRSQSASSLYRSASTMSLGEVDQTSLLEQISSMLPRLAEVFFAIRHSSPSLRLRWCGLE